MSKILNVADPQVLVIPIKECQESLVDIRDRQELQYGEPPESPLTAECYTKLRATVFKKLCSAQADLPHNWRFKLYEGYRSLKVQQMLFDQIYKSVVERDPQANQQKHFYETTRLVSPVTSLDGSQNIPAHNTGGAVDIEIVTNEGQLIDMGMALKDWNKVEPDLCLTDSKLASEAAKRNRQLLLRVMNAHGFVNYPTEWWHFSYGDRYWAFHQPIKQAIYGSADLL